MNKVFVIEGERIKEVLRCREHEKNFYLSRADALLAIHQTLKNKQSKIQQQLGHIRELIDKYGEEIVNEIQNISAGNGLTLHLGSFWADSGKLLVCDPCTVKVWEKGLLLPVQRGCWNVAVDWGGLGVGRLHLQHLTSVPVGKVVVVGEVFVDSGEFAILSTRKAKEYAADFDKFYHGVCCDIASSGFRCGIIPGGCVTSSGYGDGTYPVQVWYGRHKLVTEIEVKFI